MVRGPLTRILICAFVLLSAVPSARGHAAFGFLDDQVTAHPGQSGSYVLDTGDEALIARAWLTDHAERTLDVQYFIWSTDNVGILAAEALLRAADRGVKIRVIVDDLLMDAPDESLLALAHHPNIDIRIYNPKSSVGTPLQKKVVNVTTDFRGVNQRMHNKVLLIDGKVAITGGRNMADEYFDYDHEYNFRDRDVLLVGSVIRSIGASFEQFWASPLSVPVEQLYDGIGLMQKHVEVGDAEVQEVYRGLHAYAAAPENFAPEVRAAIEATPQAFPRLGAQTVWGKVEFISDLPGKNDNKFSLGGGGLTTAALARLVEGANETITIQSPYLVASDAAIELFRRAVARGVKVRINTNSLASTDNLMAFSGYRSQRKRLLQLGFEITEVQPEPVAQRELLAHLAAAHKTKPVAALHAKTLVVDHQVVFIGTFNFDPRSENLNTEAGAIIHDARLASAVEQAIAVDMQAGNSWDAAKDDPDSHASFGKRSKVRLWQILPIKPLL
ncbi:MAG TPA: phospholipase D family protein [Steroidobacteraceae bacterium]|nr:phospholipase D family protein [Steroidobacteraceae bacterium]